MLVVPGLLGRAHSFSTSLQQPEQSRQDISKDNLLAAPLGILPRIKENKENNQAQVCDFKSLSTNEQRHIVTCKITCVHAIKVTGYRIIE